MKRFDAPSIYPLNRKQGSYVLTPEGPHPADRSIPLGVVLRDMLGVADTLREAKTILTNRSVQVDGTVQTNPRYTVGVMDVVTLTPLDTRYRFTVTEDGATLTEISGDAADTKLCKVTGKTMLPGGDTQIHLHDGKNIVSNDECSPGDTLRITLPGHDIDTRLPFQEGSTVLITDGKHQGKTGEITGIRTVHGSNPNLVTVEEPDGTTFETTPDYLYVIDNQMEEELQ